MRRALIYTGMEKNNRSEPATDNVKGILWALVATALFALAAAVTLGFAQVFFVSLIALLVLNEAVGPHRIIASVIGLYSTSRDVV